MAVLPTDENDAAIEQWKIRRLIKSLAACRGNGTSMISLIIPPKGQISLVAKMLGDEYGTASNIKSRVNRLSVLGAITSAQQRLKLYNKVPPNGLVLYCGEIMTDDGKEKKVNIDFEPFKPINTSLYMCDNKFHTEDLNQLLESDDRYGFIIMDGNGALFGAVQGNNREIITRFSVELPKKHGRGGQSSMRFARIRLEKRGHYVTKVAETATTVFITNDKPNVSGLILAGSAEFKNTLASSDCFDPRLSAVLLKIVDVSYGGENGFNQAIELSGDTLKDVKFVQEKKLIGKYFEEIAQDTGKVCFGVDETLQALEMGAVETLVVYENLPVTRYSFRDPNGGEKDVVRWLLPDQEKDAQYFRDSDTGVDMELLEKMPMTEWLVQNYKSFGAKLEFVTNKSQEGAQFVRGFGGIGGLLRYRVELSIEEDYEGDSGDDFM